MDKPISLLVVDDDAGMIQTLNYVFTEKGYEVVTLNHGAEAVELVKKRSFDIIFSDLKMPGMNGVEMVRQIKRVAPETSFVMISAYSCGSGTWWKSGWNAIPLPCACTRKHRSLRA